MEIEGERMLGDQERRTKESGMWRWREPKSWQEPHFEDVPTGSASCGMQPALLPMASGDRVPQRDAGLPRRSPLLPRGRLGC